MIRLEHVRFQYGRERFELTIPHLEIAAGQRWALIGPSGSGKTTLLHMMAGIHVPHTGHVWMGDVDIARLSDSQRRAFRAQHVGMIFQEFELLDYLNVRDNILLPYRIHPSLAWTPGVSDRAEELARVLGMQDKLRRPIRQLSQGERQRVAIARGLVTAPSFVLADEPTGNLDPYLKRQVVDLLLRTLEDHPATLVFVTHDHTLLDRFDRILPMEEVAAGSGERSAPLEWPHGPVSP